ncbi:uncharacterized protein PHACADRAFT_206297 [Phanerochaete carnosa HHB-10118-sp]|uniref:NACHT domain-containing protein n=1 Tax=Phanerochaete carnosa (strain HHB-10118-sp) TaxID=650164 RepID=K5WLN0_PHACS|nr:uncharacterized protein PHACADRAFT_206297 [Phanerochaete carnosa HHB-10118-sp]EKM60099.1 hypothetical protein PHACADRAFT_206297 [Phanerochaete carnosa HHB-10118-sp]
MRRLKQKLRSGKVPDAAVGHLKQALGIFKDTAGSLGVPGLQIGVSILSAVLAMIQKSNANTESINTLATQIGELTAMVKRSTELHGGIMPAPMGDRVKRLLESWKSIDNEAQNIKSRKKFLRVIESEEEAGKVASLVKKILWSIQSFIVEGMLAIEFALDHQARINEQSSQYAEMMFDALRSDNQRLQMHFEGGSVPPYVVRAQFDSHPERKVCLDGTRTDMLETIFNWAAGQSMPGEAAEPAEDPQAAGDQPNVLWLNGLPGSGKTTIACSVAQRCRANRTLGANFFCSRSDSDCSNASLIFTTIAYQLGLFYEPYKDQVAEILKKDPQLAYSGVPRQFEELIVQPLAHLREGFPPCVIVIDALDECRDPQVTSAVLSTLLNHAEDLSPLRFFVTSRPERHIAARFDAPGYRNASGRLLLHEVALECVTTDIKKYFTVSLSELRLFFNLAESWPNEADIEVLSRMANGLFIFAATAIKFIGDPNYNDPIGQMKILTSAAGSHGFHRLLDKLYLQVLDAASPNMSTSLLGRLKAVLGSIAVIKDPLPPSGLSHLLGLPTDTVYSSLVGLHSVLVVPAAQESAANICVIHPTFPEFLLDPSRCTSRLKRDICGIRDPSLLNVEVPGLLSRIESAIPAHLRYACRHWCTHLLNCELSDEILDELFALVQRQLLHWIEACSLLGILRDVVSGINEAQRKLRDFDDDRARDIIVLLNDCERLVVGYFPAISSSALQLYYSIVSFIPTKTVLSRTYVHECLPESSIKAFGSVPGMWNACLGTVTAHEGSYVWAVDFPLDGRTVASSGDDGKIRIWDALTCALLSVLSGHSHRVWSVKYSSDGARIASAAADRTVKIWDAVSGVLVRTLEGHMGWVRCAVFTPDGGRIVSGSDDHSIKIWDTETGACLATLTVHNHEVKSIAVSRDGRWMASGSLFQVCLWSLEAPAYTHRVVATPKGECFPFDAATFTPDSSQILIASYIFGNKSGKLSVWDVETAKHLRDLRPSGQSFKETSKPSFLSTGDMLVCAADNTVLVWDFARGEVRQAFSGHTEDVTSVAYNQDGTRIMSGSMDGTVRLWDVTQPEHTRSPSNLSSERSMGHSSVTFSHNAKRALLVSTDESSTSIEVAKTDSWGHAYKPLPIPLLEHLNVHHIAFSPDDATILTASSRYHSSVALWDAASGSPRLQLEGKLDVARRSSPFEYTFMWSDVLGYMPHCFGCQSSTLMFSQDSRYLLMPNLSTTGDHHSACLWDVVTGKLIREFVGHTDSVSSVAFSLDGRRIATGSDDTTVIIWDAATGASLAICRGHKYRVVSVAFSPSGERVASGGYDNLVLVWNADGGRLTQELEGHAYPAWSVAFAPAGDVIISSQSFNTMRLWDAESGACLLVLDPHTWYRTLHLSPDGSGVLVDDNNRLVQLWAPVDADAQVTTPLPWLPRRTWPIYYIEDDWIFSLTPSRRTRLCWVPLGWQRGGIVGYCGHNVVFKSGYRLNFSELNRYLGKLHSNHT